MLNDSVRLPFGTSGALTRDRLVRERWMVTTPESGAGQHTTKGGARHEANARIRNRSGDCADGHRRERGGAAARRHPGAARAGDTGTTRPGHSGATSITRTRRASWAGAHSPGADRTLQGGTRCREAPKEWAGWTRASTFSWRSLSGIEPATSVPPSTARGPATMAPTP